MYVLIRRRELLLLVPMMLGVLFLIAGRWAARWSDDQVIAYNNGLSALVNGDLDGAQKQTQQSLQIFSSNGDDQPNALNPGPSIEAAARAYELEGVMASSAQDPQGALRNFQACISLVEDARYHGTLTVDTHAIDLVEMECRYNFELTAKAASGKQSSQSKPGNGNQQAPQPQDDGQKQLGSGNSSGNGL